MPPKPPVRLPRKPPSPSQPKACPSPPVRSSIAPSSTRRAAQPRPLESIILSTPRPLLKSRVLLSLGSTVLFIFGTVIFVRDNMVSFDTVHGSSMAPTLSPDAHEQGKLDKVIIKRGITTKDVKRGDIITFWKPHKPNEISIKRVVGLAGDTVFPSRGYAVDSSSFNTPRLGLMDGLPDVDGSEPRGDVQGKVVVPHGHVWVEGDNWRRTYDSRDFGPVSRGLIDGKATSVWRRGWFREIEDLREKGHMSRVVRATRESRIPDVFLE